VPVRGACALNQQMSDGVPEPIDEVRQYLDRVSEQWDQALSRFKSFVEG